ncbi:ABC transporter substrate-binding protein [Desulfovibrio oxamicus]|uniref:ABC transporter substrate-binding protein n=1 Tax=Nitratidesulfovibrio oxamicus TaxID=32016 RepID=A0ABS0J4V2_9BACT|nr:ABC transporter substrate-binding protein [Nitratidesulfovibrio oxamicus]MBG3877021.1 ABC transporter substrate-binding protein [Nitratidesulfovibrio oxamicus]
MLMHTVRRGVLLAAPLFKSLSCALLCALLAWAAPALAATDSAGAARTALKTSVDRILDIVKQPGYTDAAQRPALMDQVENEIRRIFDFREFSARTVGMNWPSFTPDQQDRFAEAFASLLRATYLEKFDGYTGQQVLFTGELVSGKGDKVEVQTTVVIKDKQVPVAYRMLQNRQQNWVVYDVIIEGVSMVKNYRTQFQDLLEKGTADQLIERVRVKADEVRKQPAQSGQPGQPGK